MVTLDGSTAYHDWQFHANSVDRFLFVQYKHEACSVLSSSDCPSMQMSPISGILLLQWWPLSFCDASFSIHSLPTGELFEAYVQYDDYSSLGSSVMTVRDSLCWPVRYPIYTWSCNPSAFRLHPYVPAFYGSHIPAIPDVVLWYPSRILMSMYACSVPCTCSPWWAILCYFPIKLDNDTRTMFYTHHRLLNGDTLLASVCCPLSITFCLMLTTVLSVAPIAVIPLPVC